VDLVGDPVSVRYRSGRAEGFPEAGRSFSGTVVGFGSGDNFKAFAAFGLDGLPVVHDMVAMFGWLKSHGLSLPPVNFATEPGITKLSKKLDYDSSHLLIPNCVGMLKGMNHAAVLFQADSGATPASEPVADEVATTEESSPTNEVSQTEEATNTAEPDPDDERPVALVSGGFSKPHGHYIGQLNKIGYQVVDHKGLDDLPDFVKLVVHPSAGRHTSLSRQASEREGVETLTASGLNEKARAHRVRSGG